MRLKHIKLAGFKSFVDPTTVAFEQQMTAIVGPNGCGKSNIIDAVRWVLGESSAKNLRGEAMTDVIFNGAASRKPIGQASVELVFDNAQGKIQGQMADRSQVSVRRLVNREGTNSYFLNGSKCRRKDISEIFLGTGLGPRSYAIIEQGTISRLIESKPQELRIFIEEAAGISKYKERRKETENRIRHTRENLARLSDIRAELDVQIDKLHQQAEAAKRFRDLKQQERKYKAELAVLRWQKYQQQYQEHQASIASLAEKIAGYNTQLSGYDVQMLALKAKILACNDSNQALQQQKLNLTQEIARAEQQVKYLQAQAKKTASENQQTQQQLLNAQGLIASEQEQLQKYNQQLAQQQPQLQILERDLTQCQTELTQQTDQQQQLQRQWQLAQQKSHELQQQKQGLQAKITQQQTITEQLNEQIIALSEQRALLILAEPAETKVLEQAKCEAQKAVQQLQYQVAKLNSQLAKLQATTQQLNQELAIVEAQLSVKQQALARSQLALNDRSPWSEKQATWFQEQGIKSVVNLQTQLKVTEGWELAVELVLSHYLAGHLLNSLPDADVNGNLAADNLCFVYQQLPSPCRNQKPIMSTSVAIKNKTLASKVSGVSALTAYFNRIHIADNYRDAKQQLSHLQAGESVICPDGTWLSHHMLSKGKREQGYDYLSLQRQCDAAQSELAQLQTRQQELTQQLNIAQQSLKQFSADKNSAQDQLDSKTQDIHKLEQSLLSLVQNVAHQQAQDKSLSEQIAQLQERDKRAQTKLAEYQAALAPLQTNAEHNIDQLAQQQQQIQQTIADTQTRSQNLYQQRHQLSLAIEQLKSQRQQAEQNIAVNQKNINLLTERLNNNQQLDNENSAPLKAFEAQLPQWLDNLGAINDKLQHNQQQLNDSQTQLAELERNYKSCQAKIASLKEQLARLQLDSEGFKLRAESALEVLSELQQDIEHVVKAMPAQAKTSHWQAHLVKLAKDIQQLGAINLAAIEEYESQYQRKSYLDQQDQDLNNAITTLEAVIAKIDKESRHKFKLTFDQVNKDLQALFPKVFGGGQAYLTLTGDDLLETGVAIMARPPGKKNSSIHLLSGGEKALTALSLVFAIFRLNPAPFCLLDEVDAPLDDANVSRFCNLVREMSQTVQFIYISHNKIAMEMASHLTGVTMFEPGVSRMVAVDIDEAVAMVEV
ncbi:condensin subunit Smc [Colwellia chukchiensis]|uniref:Chromosome partition protein Smc n=1 Tax=Colwellia chukchiensis TaxID=641665 RepID=A0A1H7TGZ0_9GAMM|nr:chromosome segregation protein SMC [Colwellia chukchiensis]SEL83606.1 condensin subunit Smc [Colwellia chukchiensis]